MVVFSPPLPDHAQVGDPGHISDHNALLEAAKTLNSGKIDYSHHTAKGTLVSASAANVPGTLTVGTDDMVLLVDSSQTLGLKWAQLPTGGITDSAVTTAKIADGSVTTAKIANDTITAAQIAANAVGSSELADNAVNVAALDADDLGNGLVLTADSGEPSGMKWSAYGIADLDIGTVDTGSPAAASMTGNPEDGYELNLTLPPVGDGSITNIAVNAAADIDRTKIAGTALTAESMGIFNVKDYGAVGDGTTDDTVAVEAAIAAAGVGGVVYFPQGAYQVSRTLWPMHGQIWRGVHSPKYKNTDDPDSTCYIFPGAVFTGRALIERAASVNGVTIDQLCLLGKGDEDPVSLDGVHLGDMSYERTWIVKNCTIHGFSNSGVTGRLHVFDMRDCHVARNGYGLRVTGGNALTDVRITGCQFYYNLHGGLCLDVTTRSNGMVSVHGCRFERSGSTPGVPSVNRDPYAPGIRIQKGYNIDLVQCSTDANSGPGLEILGDTTAGMYTFGITVDSCKFARDGGGDQSAGVQLPGVKIKGASSIYFQSNVTWGEADDDGASGLISPYYSVWLEDAPSCRIANSWIVAPNPLNSVYRVGNTSGTVVDGAASYMDLLGTDTQNKEIRFRVDDGIGNTYTRWASGVNPTANDGTYSVQRYDATGVYVDSPININWATGLVETGRIYAKAQAVGQVPLEVRSSDTSPTNSYFVAAKSDGTKVFEVQWNGRVRSNWGSNAFAIQQQGEHPGRAGGRGERQHASRVLHVCRERRRRFPCLRGAPERRRHRGGRPHLASRADLGDLGDRRGGVGDAAPHPRPVAPLGGVLGRLARHPRPARSRRGARRDATAAIHRRRVDPQRRQLAEGPGDRQLAEARPPRRPERRRTRRTDRPHRRHPDRSATLARIEGEAAMNREPLAIRAAAIWAAQSLILAAVAFGWNLSAEQIATSFTAVSALSALAVVVWTRGKVTPVDDPRGPDGQPLRRPGRLVDPRLPDRQRGQRGGRR
jgi:hypothetical protein